MREQRVFLGVRKRAARVARERRTWYPLQWAAFYAIA